MNTLRSFPAKHIKGDTLKVTVAPVAYPSNTWTMKVVFRGPSAGFTIDATPNGTGFDIVVPSSTSQALASGVWVYQAKVTNGAEDYTAFSGDIEFTPNLSDSTDPYDARSQVKRTLDAINAVIENRASKDQQQYTIAGRTLVKMPVADLLAMRKYYKSEYSKELDTERKAKGLPSTRKTLVRFTGS